MAASPRWSCFLFLVALLPTFGGCIRPFAVPKNLFVHGTSLNTLPEGVRVIRREAHDEVDLETPQEFLEDLHGRFRRDASPKPEVFLFSLGYYDTYFMYWPRNDFSENYVFLLGKNTTRIKSSNVFVSTNYGKSFTSLNLTSSSAPSTTLIDQIYYGKADPKLCILADVENKVLYRTDDLVKFEAQKVLWVPSYLTFHPWDRNFVLGYDKLAEKLYLSKDSGKKFNPVQGEVKSFNWGFQGLDSSDVFFVEIYQKPLQQRLKTRDSRTKVIKVDSKGNKTLATNVEEFEMMKNYMFITTRMDPKAKNPILQIVKDRNYPFKNTSFPSNEESRDFFVFDVVEDHVFVVINHLRNLSNMYVSDMSGLKYQLSLPRVLYHNPFTNVSSPWLRSVIPYAFVDVDRIKSMRGIYIATQLTPGPVGKRHLLTLITYNRGGKWQRVRSPTVDNRGVRINCYLPSCSIHLNLLYGAVYRVSPSERLLSSESAPGLVIGLGVASTNLKIYPDLFVSRDGGLGWSRVLRGKYLFTFGDHGGVIVAVPYRRYTKTLRYSIDGGFTWKPHDFSSAAILARDIVTQPGERLPIFVIYGNGNRNRAWTAFYIDMTKVMGPLCNSSGFTTFTDGCLLGRQQQFETRNFTTLCRTGRNFSRALTVKNCECTRDDFQCDYGFERKQFDEECTPIKSEDLDDDIIPENCPEGTNYSRTQGFRKIEGDTCVNGSEKDFLPVLTPCPIRELKNLTLTGKGSNNIEDGSVVVETGAKVYFNVSLSKAYQPNVAYRWFFGDNTVPLDGTGQESATQEHTYSKPGKYIVSVVASNTRSTLVQRLEVHVQEKLAANRMMVKFSPKDPGVNEDVTLSVHLNYSMADVGYVVYNWTYDDKAIQGWQPVVTLSFSKAKSYVITVTATNYLSSITKSVTVPVLKDLTPVNVTASVLGPTRVLVKWEQLSAEAIKLIKEYRVYKSTSGNTGFKTASCKSLTNSSCILDNLSSATTYYIKVSTYSQENKESAFSNLAFVTTNTSTPGAPQSLRAYPLNSSAIRVDWKDPANLNGSIKSYTIRYWSHNDATVKTVDNGRSSFRVFTKLQQDTVYFFEVFVNSDSGRSIAAGPAQALTKLSKPTLPPRDIKKVSDNGTCAILKWKPPYLSKSDNRSFPAKGYTIQRPDGSTVDAPTNFGIICKLPPGDKYELKVWAYSQAGEGPPASINISTQIIKPGAPQKVRASKILANEITLEWKPPAPSKGSLTYEVSQLNPRIETPFKVPPSQTTFTVKKLDPYTTYKFAVYAKNSLGSGVMSEVVKVTTQETTPGVVEFVTTEPVPPYSASIRVTWSTPSKPNGAIKSYKIKWGKTIIEHPSDTDRFEVTTVDGSESAYTFKHLFNNTYYSFVVTAVNNAGEGLQHISPKKERTETALKGTETLSMTITGPIMYGEDKKRFIREFIKVASMKANLLGDRIAAVDVHRTEEPSKAAVVFDLIPPLNSSGVSMEIAKAAINNGFKASDWDLDSGSLRTVSRVDVTAAPGEKPSVGAQKGGSPDDGSQKKTLAIIIPLALIGVALLVGLIFYYMKYKSLEKHYRQMSDKDHEEDEMKEVYHEEMQADSPDNIFGDHMKKGRSKVYRDSEKVPLGESDELAMI